MVNSSTHPIETWFEKLEKNSTNEEILYFAVKSIYASKIFKDFKKKFKNCLVIDLLDVDTINKEGQNKNIIVIQREPILTNEIIDLEKKILIPIHNKFTSEIFKNKNINLIGSVQNSVSIR